MKTIQKRIPMPIAFMWPFVLLILSLVPPALGNMLTVTSFADNNGNPNTLRSMVKAANDGDTINFSDALDGFTITLLNGEIVVNKNLTIVGPTNVSISIVGGNVNDAFNHRIFHVTSPPLGTRIFQVSGLQMTGSITGTNGGAGIASSPPGFSGGDVVGGAIYSESSTILIVSNCYFLNCQAIGGNGGNAYSSSCSPKASGGAGGGAQGGAIFGAGDCYVYNSSFATNRAMGGMGGIGAQGGPGGSCGDVNGGALAIGYHNDTDLKVINCTVFGNIAQGGTGGQGGLGSFCIGEGFPTTGGLGGTGGTTHGGGIYIGEGATPTTGMIHSTIYQNACAPGAGGAGGAGENGGQAGSPGAGGQADGCGMHVLGMPLPVVDSLFAGDFCEPATFIPAGPDVYGPVLSGAFNLVGVYDGTSTGWGGGDMLGTAGPINALLGPFEYNGGYLPTLAPERGSPAIDTGTTGGIPQDEIGQHRPVVAVGITVLGGDGSDIGAYEDQCGGTAGLFLSSVYIGNSVVISWPAPAFCTKLQTSPDLLNWSDYVGPIDLVNNMNQVTINPYPINALFFRLVGL
jgi:hypothetical protein